MATTIVSTVWTLVSGPGSVDLVAPNELNCPVSGITVAGDYTFRLTATDNLGQVGSADCVLHVAENFTVKLFNAINTAGISSVSGIPDLTYTSGDNIPFSGTGAFQGTHTAFSGSITVVTTGTIPAFPVGAFHARLKVNGVPFGPVYNATSGASYTWTGLTVGDFDLIEFDLST